MNLFCFFINDNKNFSSECCGSCVQTHCVHEGKKYEIGSSWESDDDICYEFRCDVKDEQLTTLAVKKDCPYLNPKCPDNEIIQDETGCCKICNVTIPPEGNALNFASFSSKFNPFKWLNCQSL